MLVSFSFDCQNLFAANKLIHLQQTHSGDQRINDAAKSTCSETARHPTGAVTLSNVLFLCTASILQGSKCLRKVRFPAFRIRELDKKS